MDSKHGIFLHLGPAFTTTVKILLVTPNSPDAYNQRIVVLGRNGTLLTLGVSAPITEPSPK